MGTTSVGIIIFICLCCLVQESSAAAYNASCGGPDTCTANSFQECRNAICVCLEGYYENEAQDGCNAGLGNACSDEVQCNDIFAQCVSNVCSCQSTYYDDNGATKGGACVLKKNLGEECPNPATTSVLDACTKSNSACTSDDLPSPSYSCQCISSFTEQDGSCVDTSVCSTDSDCLYGGTCLVGGNPKTCVCLPGYSGDNCGTVIKLGDNCPRIDDCNGITNANCSVGICKCNSGFYSTGELSCQRRYLDQNCSESNQCTEISNTECQSSVCKCQTGYFQIGTGQTGNCTRRFLDQSCSADNQCTEISNTECKDLVCKCQTGYYQIGTGNTGTCTKRSVGQSCTDTSQCNDSNAECIVVINNEKQCYCKDGYFNDRMSCKRRYLNQSCNANNQCSEISNTVCQNSVCKCQTGYYQIGTGQKGTCTRRYLDQSCNTNNQCTEINYTECKNFVCKCQTGYFQSGTGNTGNCTRRYLDQSCSESNQCTEISNTECQSSVCKCQTGYFQIGTGSIGTCTRRYLDQSCNANNQCSEISNTVCQGSVCKCQTGYYQDGNGQTGNCTKRNLGEQCTGMGQCSALNADCETTTCQCNNGYYQTTGPNVYCVSITKLQVSNIQFVTIQTNQMKVRWIAPAASDIQYVSRYTIQWRPTTINSINADSANIDSSSTTYLLKQGIDPGRAYTVTIVSNTNQMFQGSTRKTSLMSEQAAKPGITSGINMTSSESDASDGSIKVAWNAPSGYVSGYIIILLDGTIQIRQSTPSGPSEREATFYSNQNPQLKNGYRYKVTIQAKSEIYGNGKTVSGEIFMDDFKTTPKIPSAPRFVQCDIIKDESITLTWTAPAFPNGDLEKYTINVFDQTMRPLPTKNTNTSGVVESHSVAKLDPGTYYIFQVFTVNEMYISTTFGKTSVCQTKAKLSEPPRNLTATDVSSRIISISWNEPNNSYSEEINGYVIQVKNGTDCVKEVIFSCSDCFYKFQISDLDNMCNRLVQTVIDKKKDELKISQSHSFTDLSPDTTYSIFGTVVNSLGRGNVATITTTTEEEAPQIPYNVAVDHIEPTMLTVTWSIDEPRPGKTDFTVNLIADSPAPNKTITLTGYYERSYKFNGLEEYWNYSVIVTATTSKGAKSSEKSQEYRTFPAAPGQVSDLTLTPHPGGNYTRMKITWKAPPILQQNSVIKDYSFSYLSIQDSTSLGSSKFNHQSSEGHMYEVMVDVVPEQSYNFEVFATNQENVTGDPNTKSKMAPPGVPPNIEDTGVTVINKDEVSNIGETSFTVPLAVEFFEVETYGVIRATGLIACKKACEGLDVMSLSDFNKMTNWKTFSQGNMNNYRVTPEDWRTKLKEKNAGNSRRKRSTVKEYTIGSGKCTSDDESSFCNAPLQPGTSYVIKAVSCTNGGCLLSNDYGPIATKVVPDVPDNTPMIIGIVVAVVVLVGIGAVVGFILIRKRRGPGKMKPASDSDDDDFTTIDPAISKIKRKRPFLLSDIEDYVNNMHKDSNLLFSSEYEDLKTLSPKHSCDAADREENRMRNRYINIIPFDHTRVKLSTNGEDDPCDYINANYLPGYTSPREYIGCQGPIPGTIDDFWRMTWEQNVSVIVMLTLCKEGQKIKCEQYWPEDVAEPKQYGDVIVEMTSYSNIRTYDYRLFKITNGNQTRVIKHFHFLSWLDFQANVHHDIILDFILQVRQHVQPPDTSGPMIVHCSAGVGRTGTYIALDHLMQFINEHDFDVQVDIFDMVLNLRENRQHMVQTEQQYVFIHDCVKEILERKRRNMENIYENEAFWKKRTAQDENIYQNEQQNLYANVAASGHEQNTEL